jgi:hypothetical protein
MHRPSSRRQADGCGRCWLCSPVSRPEIRSGFLGVVPGRFLPRVCPRLCPVGVNPPGPPPNRVPLPAAFAGPGSNLRAERPV